MAADGSALERLTVLVVDDCDFVREVVSSVVRTLGVGQTLAAQNGVDAVRKLAMTRSAPDKVGTARIDLVISDVVMPQLDGIDLLRWIRASQASPGRFMPVVMLSAASEPKNVASARDAGANAFIGKPFTPHKLARRLLSVIGQPRDFIHCASYFGPDRRRRDGAAPDGERRRRDPSEVPTAQLIHDQPRKLQGVGEVLRYKLATMTGGRVDDRRLALVDDIIRGGHTDYEAWLARAVAQLKHLAARAAAKPQAARPARSAITRIAVDLRGHGVMFGYPLISAVGRSLYDCTTRVADLDADALTLVDAHIDAIDGIIDADITGDDDARGTALLETLAAARRAFEERSPAVPA